MCCSGGSHLISKGLPFPRLRCLIKGPAPAPASQARRLQERCRLGWALRFLQNASSKIKSALGIAQSSGPLAWKRRERPPRRRLSPVPGHAERARLLVLPRSSPAPRASPGGRRGAEGSPGTTGSVPACAPLPRARRRRRPPAGAAPTPGILGSAASPPLPGARRACTRASPVCGLVLRLRKEARVMYRHRTPTRT